MLDAVAPTSAVPTRFAVTEGLLTVPLTVVLLFGVGSPLSIGPLLGRIDDIDPRVIASTLGHLVVDVARGPLVHAR